MIARALVALAALAGAAVLAADLRTTREIDAAVARAAVPARVAGSIATLRDVAEGTSDTAPLLRAAEIQLSRQDYGGAQAAALTAARREPDNAEAWLLVGLAAGGSGDRDTEAMARLFISRLVARP